MKRFIILILTLFAFIAIAQKNRLVQATVQTAQSTKPGEWQLTVEKPAGFIAQENSGFVIGKFDADNLYRNQVIAYASKQFEKEKTVDITFSTFDELKPGDIVLVEIPLPEKIINKGIYFALARMDFS